MNRSTASLIHTIAFTSFVALAATIGCSDGAYEEDQSYSSQELVTSNARTAYNFFVARGLSAVQSAAIVGSLQQESTPNLDPTIRQPGGLGRGIAQWGVGQRWDTDTLNGRPDNLRAFAASRGQSMTALSTQLAFIWYELSTFPTYGLASLRAARTIETAVSAFSSRYERCGRCNDPRRVQYARAIYNALANQGVAPEDADAGTDAAPEPTDPPPTGKPGSDDPNGGDYPEDENPPKGGSSGGSSGKGGDDDGSEDDDWPDKGGGGK